MEGILDTVRKILGGDMVDPHFNPELIIHINTVIAILDQIGVTVTTKTITENTTWNELIPEVNLIEEVKTFLPLKVKMIFDPPTGSSAMNALEKTISECEWRILVAMNEGVKNNE